MEVYTSTLWAVPMGTRLQRLEVGFVCLCEWNGLSPLVGVCAFVCALCLGDLSWRALEVHEVVKTLDPLPKVAAGGPNLTFSPPAPL